MERNKVIEKKEKVVVKVEILRESQPRGSSGKKYPSKFFKEDSWYKRTMQDAKE
jgi:hypothetical protein